jgi:hypothetical protein
MRFYVPLAPVVILAAVASVNACGKDRGDETDRLRVVPPPAVLAQAPAPRPAAFQPAPAPEPAGTSAVESEPSAEEVREFERPVAK